MTSFTISNDSIDRLTALFTISDKLEKSKLKDDKKKEVGTLISFADDKMSVHVTGNRSIVEYKIDIENFSKDPVFKDGPAYINLDLAKLGSSLVKCSLSGTGAAVRIDHALSAGGTARVTVASTTDNTKIVFNCFGALEERLARHILNDWDMRMETSHFTGETVDVEINESVIKFADTAAKFMSILQQQSTIGISKDHLRFFSRVGILDKKVSGTLTESDETFVLNKNVLDFVKPIYKDTKEPLTLTYSAIVDGKRNFIKIDNDKVGIRAVLDVSDMTFSFMDQASLSAIIPDPLDEVKFNINKKELELAIQKFEGLFNPATYKWKQVNVIHTAQNYEDNILNIEYHDTSGQVSTNIPIEKVSNNSSEAEFIFMIPGLILSGILDCIEEDQVTISYSAVPYDEPHGMGISISSLTMNAICVKITD